LGVNCKNLFEYMDVVVKAEGRWNQSLWNHC